MYLPSNIGKRMRIFCAVTGLFFSTLVFAQEKTPVVGSHISGGMNAVSMILSLFIVLAVIVVSAYLLKRFNIIQNTTQDLKVVASLPLTAKEKLVVVQVGEKQLLLGVTNQQINLIESLENPLIIQNVPGNEQGRSIWDFLKSNTVNSSTIKKQP